MREHGLVRRSRSGSDTADPRTFLSYEVPYANSLWRALCCGPRYVAVMLLCGFQRGMVR